MYAGSDAMFVFILSLVRNLDVEDELIDQIYHDFHADGLRQIIYEGIKIWMQQQGSRATIGALARVCKKTEHQEALEDLQNFVTYW